MSSFPFFDLITLACVGRSPTDEAAAATEPSWKAYLMGVISTREGGRAPLTHPLPPVRQVAALFVLLRHHHFWILRR